MKIAVIGANGNLGSRVKRVSCGPGFEPSGIFKIY